MTFAESTDENIHDIQRHLARMEKQLAVIGTGVAALLKPTLTADDIASITAQLNAMTEELKKSVPPK